MYNEQDILKINKLIKTQIIIFSVYTIIMLCVIAATVYIWQQLITMLAVALYLMGMVFWGDLKLMPLVKYRRFLREINEGLSRDTEGIWLSIDDDFVIREGVEAYTVQLDEGLDVARQLYWDNDKPIPDIKTGQRVQLVTHGAFIKSLELII